MIVCKDLRADVLGEPLFDKVSLVVPSGERVAVVGSDATGVTVFLRILAGEQDSEEGTVSTKSETISYVSPEVLSGDTKILSQVFYARPTFIFLDCGTKDIAEERVTDISRLIRGFQGGILIASIDPELIGVVKTTRVFEVQTALRTIASYTGTYDSYVVEKEKNDVRANEAYKKQQREKQRLESWLEKKREEASINRSPDKGATIRTKVKYLQREILDKELPRPASLGDWEDNG